MIARIKNQTGVANNDHTVPNVRLGVLNVGLIVLNVRLAEVVA